MKHILTIAAFFALVFSLHFSAFAQQSNTQFDTRVNLVFGLNQLLSQGFNVEGNVFYKRLAFDYSHGVSLNFDNNTLVGDVKDQKLAIHLPYTTGFGVGYRFTEAFNVRLEPKWHRFEVYYDGEEQTASNRIGAYNTFTLGLGAYYNWRPFKTKENGLRGLMIAPSIRYWPQLSSTLDNDKFTYQNRATGREEVHEAMEVGFGNTPLVINVSIGYSFLVKKK